MSVPTRHNYLYFTRKERRGTLILLFIIAILCIIPFLLPFFIKDEVVENKIVQQSVASLQFQQDSAKVTRNSSKFENEYSRDYERPTYTSKENYYSINKELFNFDPNTIDESGWKKLGLKDKTIATILNYRNKGGKFRQAADLKKIWGLREDDAEKLIPFVQIAGASTTDQQRNYSNKFEHKSAAERSYAMVEINSADTTAFISLPGIGTKLSQRIIQFREKLGGFYKIEQLAETFALPDSTFQKIKPLLRIEGIVKTININSADINELKQHPYIKYPLANAIVQYRNQHGNYASVNDIKKIMIVDEALFQKISPYLGVD